MLVVAIGELVVDWISTTKGAGLLDAGAFYRYLGGNATNVAVALEKLGTNARLIGKIGQDIHASYVLDALNAHGLDIQYVLRDPRYPTAQCYAFWDRGDDYSYYNWPQPHAANMLHQDELTAAVLEDAGALHATGVSLSVEPRRSAILKLMRLAHEASVFVSFDAVSAENEDEDARQAMREAMQLSDFLKVNYYELMDWSAVRVAPLPEPHLIGGKLPDDLIAAARVLYLEYKPALLAVTLGEGGSLLMTATAEVYCPAFRVDTIAAIGAGDAHIAGILHQLCQRAKGAKVVSAQVESSGPRVLSEIGNFANAVGALATRSLGACDGLPRLAEVEQLVGTREPQQS